MRRHTNDDKAHSQPLDYSLDEGIAEFNRRAIVPDWLAMTAAYGIIMVMLVWIALTLRASLLSAGYIQ